MNVKLSLDERANLNRIVRCGLEASGASGIVFSASIFHRFDSGADPYQLLFWQGEYGLKAHQPLACSSGVPSMDQSLFFDLASDTKPMVAAVCLILASIFDSHGRPLLNLNQTVRSILANGKNGFSLNLSGQHTAEMTVMHLLSYGCMWNLGSDFKDLKDHNEMVRRYLNNGLQAPPGHLHQYLNPPGWFLGKIIEAVTGMPLAQAMKQFLFDPLNMETAAFCVPDGVVSVPTVSSFTVGGKTNLYYLSNRPQDPNAHVFWGAGEKVGIAGAFGRASDLHKFAAFLTSGHDVNGKQLIQPELLSMMFENQWAGKLGGDGKPTTLSFGLGQDLQPADWLEGQAYSSVSKRGFGIMRATSGPVYFTAPERYSNSIDDGHPGVVFVALPGPIRIDYHRDREEFARRKRELMLMQGAVLKELMWLFKSRVTSFVGE